MTLSCMYFHVSEELHVSLLVYVRIGTTPTPLSQYFYPGSRLTLYVGKDTLRFLKTLFKITTIY